MVCYYSVLQDAVAKRKVRHKSVDLKTVHVNVLKGVTRITKGGGGIELVKLIWFCLMDALQACTVSGSAAKRLWA